MPHTHAKTSHPVLAPHKHRVHAKARAVVEQHHLITRDTIKAALITTGGGVLLAVLISLGVQLSYPRSMALPYAHIGGKSYGFRSEAQIVADITALQERKMRITSGSQILEHTPKELGITFTSKEDAKQATRYGWRERLVPFSFFLERRDIPNYGFKVDETQAKKLVATFKKYDKPPVDAAVHLEDAKVVITKQQDGYIYDANYLVQAIKELKLNNSMSIALQPTTVQPAITDDIAIDVVNTLQQRMQQSIVVQADGKSATADPALLASWAVLTPDAQNKKLHIGYDKGKVKQWLAGLASQVYRSGAPRTVTLLDGEVAGDTNAADGVALNVDATADAVVAAAVANQPAATGVISPVVVMAQTNRNYTRSSKGLQALLNYWDASNSGTWGIMLKSLDGNISASFNPDRQFTSASVYKIYIAYVVYTKSDNGELSMGSPTSTGNTVSGCLDIMIVRSDNACAAALGDMIGWNANNGMLHAKGFGSTSIEFRGQLTTAQDTTNYLMQLQNGSLLSAGNREALLYKMSHNIYRYAIPAGSVGMPSANKLGAAGTYNHDVAIVYHPKGTYVLSVLSCGSDHYRIRELARQIAAVMSK